MHPTLRGLKYFDNLTPAHLLPYIVPSARAIGVLNNKTLKRVQDFQSALIQLNENISNDPKGLLVEDAVRFLRVNTTGKDAVSPIDLLEHFSIR